MSRTHSSPIRAPACRRALSNPPFGRKSSLIVVGADGREAREDCEIELQDFVVTTSNKQPNFLQHVATVLGINGWPHGGSVLSGWSDIRRASRR